jgi:hypothetical protein
MEGIAKCHHLKKITCKRDFADLSEPRTSYPPPLTHCIKYTYSHREGGGGELNKEKYGGVTVQKAGSKIPA